MDLLARARAGVGEATGLDYWKSSQLSGSSGKFRDVPRGTGWNIIHHFPFEGWRCWCQIYIAIWLLFTPCNLVKLTPKTWGEEKEEHEFYLSFASHTENRKGCQTLFTWYLKIIDLTIVCARSHTHTALNFGLLWEVLKGRMCLWGGKMWTGQEVWTEASAAGAAWTKPTQHYTFLGIVFWLSLTALAKQI